LGIGQQSDLTTTSIPEIDPTTLRRTRVLVVEDNDTILELIESILESIGVKSTSVTNGKEAIDMLSRVGPGAFDLVLMDIQMPLMDGWSATRTIRMMKGFERVPIIALSAHSMAHEKQRCEEAGMNDHVCKPFDQQTLYRCLAKWVR
jgi:CheY-like chemotaxis protein